MNLKQLLNSCNIKTSALQFAVGCFLLLGVVQSYGQVTVFAGADTSICKNGELNIANLNATITGATNQGNWYTLGDGKFTPSFSSTGSFATTTGYIPGSMDRANGFVILVLNSIDPDGDGGPLTPGTDNVRINLLDSPAMICSNNINVSLSSTCTQLITPSMLVVNPVGSISNYVVELTLNGVIVPDNILTKAHLNKTLQFRVRNICGNNSCWGYMTVEDKEPPILFCEDITVDCDESVLPTSVGFPFDHPVSAVPKGEKKYEVTGADNCGKTFLSYYDEVQKITCSNRIISIITRHWEAVDEVGNKAYCIQRIYVRANGIEELGVPPNYDDITNPAFECAGNWQKLPNGHPHPNISGAPITSGCSNLETSYTDTRFDICGNSYKLARRWLMIDWCNSQTIEIIQIIKVLDKTPPTVTCPANIVLSTNAYECYADLSLVPAPTATDKCGITSFTVSIKDSFGLIKDHFIITQNGKLFFSMLPKGKYTLTYTVSDQCENTATCTTMVNVIDDKAPFAICEQFTKISFNNNGTSARLFPESIDNGSTDNCEIVLYEVAKMTDACGDLPNVFGPYVDFCCEELGTTVMVALRVTDASGNSNTCMVEVKVEDKTPPVIICPSDLTISCEYPINFDSLHWFGTVRQSEDEVKNIIIYDDFNDGVAGLDGFVKDNCSVTITTRYTENLKCSQGIIIRTFTATDASGNSAICQQRIHVKNPDPFGLEDINFPENLDITTCFADVMDTSITGYPTFDNTHCASVGYDYEDIVFEFADGACKKVLRTWTVIDWCQHSTHDQEVGIWQKSQIIKFSNYVKPELITSCVDTTICLYAAECTTTLYEKFLTAMDDCTADSLIAFHWTIDEHKDGSIDFEGYSSKISAELVPGIHKVNIIIKDGCGNSSVCTYFVTVKDCKDPTPYCIGDLVTVLMPTTGNISIKARDFDQGSTDNCTPSSLLKISFSSNVNDTIRIITCEDIPDGKSVRLNLQIWVTDLQGNQDFCETFVQIQDNGNSCEDEFTEAVLSGTITNVKGVAISNVIVRAESPLPELSKSTKTNAIGQFRFDGLSATSPYAVKPSINSTLDDGISAFDMVIIQRHILAYNKFTNPYLMIAADVDGSGKVNTADIVLLRKIMLKRVTELPGLMPIWVYIDKSFKFANEKQPYDYPEEIRYNTLLEGLNTLDIVAIKAGDVDGYLPGINGEDVGTRSINPTLPVSFYQNEFGTQFIIANTIKTDGFQLELRLNKKYQNSLTIDSRIEQYVDFEWISNDVVRILMVADRFIELEEGSSILEIKHGQKNDVKLNSNFNHEFYSREGRVKVIENQITANTFEDFTFKNDIDRVLVYRNSSLDKNAKLNFMITSINGNVLERKSSTNESETIFNLQNLSSGLYFLTIDENNRRHTYKIFVYR